MASFATMLFGTIDEVARLRTQLGRAPRDLRDAPLELTDPDPGADPERLLTLNRQPREGVSQRVLEREPDDGGADGGCRQELVAEYESGDDGEQADDDRVLEDRGERDRARGRCEAG